MLRNRSTRFVVFGTALAAGLFMFAACGNSGDTGGGGNGPIGLGDCEVAGQTCSNGCDPNLGCTECNNDADCGGNEPACVAGECKECGDSSDCGSGQSCFPEDHTCEDSCEGDGDCDGDAPICDELSGACVGCQSDADCGGGDPICSDVTKQCAECNDNQDCGAGEPICDVEDGECEECLLDSHCECSGG